MTAATTESWPERQREPVLVCANGDQAILEAGNGTAPVSEGRGVEARGKSLSGFPHRLNLADRDEEGGRVLHPQDAAKLGRAEPGLARRVLDKLLSAGRRAGEDLHVVHLKPPYLGTLT